MRIALWQSHSPAADLHLALREVERALCAAAQLEADALVMPETWLPGYNVEDPAAFAMAQDDPFIMRLMVSAQLNRCALVIGYVEAAEGKIFNAALAISAEGKILANHRKLQLFGPREAKIFSPGESYATFELQGDLVGLLICYDVEFAPHVKALADLGVSLIVVPTANMMPFNHISDYVIPAMAANHGLAIAYANLCGRERDLNYAGRSLIVGPHGEILAAAGVTPTLLVTDIPPPDPKRLSTQSRDLRYPR